MAEGVSRRFMAQRPDSEAEVDEEAQKLAGRMADLAWAGLRWVHQTTWGGADRHSTVMSVRHNPHSSSTHAA